MARLSDTEILRSLGELSDWKRSGNSIERTFEFPSFLSSHDAGGVTSRDIKLARKIDELAR